MKIIVFSDIHGNIYALEKALNEMTKYNPDRYLFLGDMAGYYYNQNECISLLNSLDNLISIKGNHDDNFLKALNNKSLLKELDNKYGKSYSLLANNITKSSFKYLKKMKSYYKENLYNAYHGSPNNYYSEYIYPDTNLELKDVNTKFLFLGHTHYLMDKQIDNVRVINPGSIGQPRDNNKPSFAVIDLLDNKVEFVRFDYNKEKLISQILSFKDKNYLIKVLNRV